MYNLYVMHLHGFSICQNAYDSAMLHADGLPIIHLRYGIYNGVHRVVRLVDDIRCFFSEDGWQNRAPQYVIMNIVHIWAAIRHHLRPNNAVFNQPKHRNQFDFVAR